MENQIFITCLASYNNGTLWGKWLSLNDKTKEEIQEEISEMLSSSPEPGAEEYFLTDYNGLISCLSSELGEYPDLNELIRLVEFIGESEERLRWLESDYHQLIKCDDLESTFRACYYGTFGSEEEFAREYYEEQGFTDHPLMNYVDWEDVWRSEFQCEGWNSISLSYHSVAIFSS